VKTSLLDTSFIVNCAESKVDFVSALRELGYPPKVLDKVVEELKLLVSKGGKRGRAAKLGLAMIARLPKVKTPSKGKTDDILLKMSSKETLMATMDAGLKRRLKAKGSPYFVLRQKQYILLIDV